MLSRISRLSVPLTASLLLVSCAPFWAKPEAEIVISRPPELGCPTALTGEIRPEEPIPDDAGFVAPETEAEIEATEKYLLWSARNQAWSREGWAIAAIAKSYCDSLQSAKPIQP